MASAILFSDETRPKLATEKSSYVFILENQNDIDLIKTCNQTELDKYSYFSIGARVAIKNEFADFVGNRKKGFEDEKYARVKEITFSGQTALLTTKVDTNGLANNNSYKEILVDGGKYFYYINLREKSSLLEKVISTIKFQENKAGI